MHFLRSFVALLAFSGAAFAQLTSIDSAGWSAQYTNPPTFAPDTSPETVSVSRAGYDAAANATTYIEPLVITARVRQPYPNQATLTASTVSLSDYVYSTDTIYGVTNGSVETSPKPIAHWVTPSRSVIGTTIGGTVAPVEIIAAHRNARSGRQVAAIKFLISDGTTTISTTVSSTVVSGRTCDRNAVVVFQLPATDITSLTAGLITINAEVYPWIGGSASVLKSVDQTAGREFSQRYFLKNTTLSANPPFAYVSTTGIDASGVVSTNPATAAASPFLTVLGAINGIHTALSATTGADGAIIRIGHDGGTPFVLGSTATTRTQKCGHLTITRDPTVARANARVSFGSAAFRPRLGGSLISPITTGALRFADIAIVRTGTSSLTGEAASQLEIVFEDVDFDNGSAAAAWLSNAHDYFVGLTFTNLTGNSPLGSAAGEHRCMRGVTADLNFGGLDGWLVAGSTITRAGSFGRGTRTYNGAIFASNRFNNIDTGGATFPIGATQDATGVAFLQNTFEFIAASAATSLRISADSATGNITHLVMHNNTLVGAGDAGRSNLLYDEAATARTHKLQSFAGNIHVQINTKSDVFKLDGTRTGNWPYIYGVGCRGEFSQFIDANNGGLGTSYAQQYPGLRANIGTGSLTRNDPLFTSYAGTTVSAGPIYTAGSGGGTYTLQATSPAKQMLPSAVLSHDLAGIARPAVNDAAGAFTLPLSVRKGRRLMSTGFGWN